jgi:glycosyltransferase involved in cell wall biosynthesis
MIRKVTRVADDVRPNSSEDCVVIVERYSSGHRLAWVAVLIVELARRGQPVSLVVPEAVMSSPEYATHLLPIEDLFTVSQRDDLVSARGMRSALRSARQRGNAAIVPGADALLATVVVLAVCRSLPNPTSLVVLRPPKPRGSGWRFAVVRVAKSSLIWTVDRLIGGADIVLLEDPLSTDSTRIWPAAFRDERFRLDDPFDLFVRPVSSCPAEIRDLSALTPVIAIVGAIDHRKKLPLAIAGWQARVDTSARLIVAGRQTDGVADWLAAQGVGTLDNITFINRYLSNQEMTWIVERSRGLVVLYDGGTSSGVVIAAGAIGRWVIASNGSRTGQVALDHRFGIACSEDEHGIGRAIDRVLEMSDSPRPVPLPGSDAFTARILRRVSPCTE